MRFGMSEKLGPRVLGRNDDMPFLGREMGDEPDYSDEIAREIDDEIRRIIEEGHELAPRVLREHIDDLHRISQILIERETIDKDQFERLLAGEHEDDGLPGAASRAPPSPSRGAGAPRPQPRSRGRSRCPARRCSRPSPKALAPCARPRADSRSSPRPGPAVARDARRARSRRMAA